MPGQRKPLQRPQGMIRALEAAEKAAAAGEVPVGAALMRGDRCIAKAGNAMMQTGDALAHAEMRVLAAGMRHLGRHGLGGCSLFVTLEPCAMCAGAILLARVGRLYYGADDARLGAIAHNGRIFSHPGINHRPEIYSGIGGEAAARLLRDFFSARRG